VVLHGDRSYDHRNISMAYLEIGSSIPDDERMGSNSRYMIDFMNKGAIRMGFYGGDTLTLDLHKKPTPKQLNTINNLLRHSKVVILDVKIGSKRGSVEIENPTLEKVKYFIDYPNEDY